VQDAEHIQAVIDDLLGAVYSLIHARIYGFKDRKGKIEPMVVRMRAKQIQSVVVLPTDFGSPGGISTARFIAYPRRISGCSKQSPEMTASFVTCWDLQGRNSLDRPRSSGKMKTSKESTMK
jgi:hypothetical protein